jgi:L-cysteine S-thiosulfotransferase
LTIEPNMAEAVFSNTTLAFHHSPPPGLSHQAGGNDAQTFRAVSKAGSFLVRSVLLAATLFTTTIGSKAQIAPGAISVVGDSIPDPLTNRPGDAANGRRIVLDREVGNCLICHRAPEGEPFQGNVGPDLTGVWTRLTAAQLRLRVVDISRLNAATIMPPYYRVEGLVRVMNPYRGKPVLDAQQVEDVIAYLETLKSN